MSVVEPGSLHILKLFFISFKWIHFTRVIQDEIWQHTWRLVSAAWQINLLDFSFTHHDPFPVYFISFIEIFIWSFFVEFSGFIYALSYFFIQFLSFSYLRSIKKSTNEFLFRIHPPFYLVLELLILGIYASCRQCRSHTLWLPFLRFVPSNFYIKS